MRVTGPGREEAEGCGLPRGAALQQGPPTARPRPHSGEEGQGKAQAPGPESPGPTGVDIRLTAGRRPRAASRLASPAAESEVSPGAGSAVPPASGRCSLAPGPARARVCAQRGGPGAAPPSPLGVRPGRPAPSPGLPSLSSPALRAAPLHPFRPLRPPRFRSAGAVGSWRRRRSVRCFWFARWLPEFGPRARSVSDPCVESHSEPPSNRRALASCSPNT